MKIEHDGTTYIDAADHAGLRCWIAEKEVEAIEDMRARYSPDSWARPEPVGDWAKDELINYLADPDAGYARASRIGGVLITDAEDHRIHWPLRNRHQRHPLADQPGWEHHRDNGEQPGAEHTGKGTSGKTVGLDGLYEPVGTMPVVGNRIAVPQKPHVGEDVVVDVKPSGAVECEASYVTSGSLQSGRARILKRKPAEIDALLESLRGARVMHRPLDRCPPSLFPGHYISVGNKEFWRRRGQKWRWCIGEYFNIGTTELHGPEREEVLRDFAASAAFREWEARA